MQRQINERALGSTIEKALAAVTLDELKEYKFTLLIDGAITRKLKVN